MGSERYNAPAPHERTLPHVPVNEQGLRELEIWLLSRLRKLLLQQFRQRGGGDGIKFGPDGGSFTYSAHNEGGFLDVTALDKDADSGFLMRLVGSPDPDGDDSGDVLLGFPIDGTQGNSTGSVYFGVGYSGDRAFIYKVDDDSGGSDEVARIDDAGITFAPASAGAVIGVHVITQKGVTFGSALTDEMSINLKSGGYLTVRDSSANIIFKITEDGTFHIKTGATWVADL